jgi:hypothetical protein
VDFRAAAKVRQRPPTRCETTVEGDVKTLNVITVHAHAENGSTLTISSPELRLK